MRSILVHKENGEFSFFHSQFSIRRSQRRRSGFTLIEMLVVIVIIVILMGVVFRLTRGAMARSDNAAEQRLVTLVRTLIEEFHAEYNIYPPVPTYLTHDGVSRQPINFRGDCPDGTRSRDELINYPDQFSYAKINGEACYFIFGLMSFFVDRSKYGKVAFEVNGSNGEKAVGRQWGAYNDEVVGLGGKITISQKDKAFAHRVWPIVAEVCNQGEASFDEPNLYQEYENVKGWCKGYTTGVYGRWAAEAGGIGKRMVDGKELKTYEEGLVYISKPPYTTYLLFSKGPDNQYDDPPDDRSKPHNKDNIYGNLGDK